MDIRIEAQAGWPFRMLLEHALNMANMFGTRVTLAWDRDKSMTVSPGDSLDELAQFGKEREEEFLQNGIWIFKNGPRDDAIQAAIDVANLLKTDVRLFSNNGDYSRILAVAPGSTLESLHGN